MVKITVSWGGQLKGSETDVVKGFVVNNHTLIGVLDQLMDGKSSVVGFNDCVWDLWWRDNWEGLHDSVGIFFSDFRNEEGTHTWTCSTSQWVGDLETLEAVASFGLFSGNIEDWID